MANPQLPPRQIIKWLDSLDLVYQVRNVRRDLSNGFVVAEILVRYYPKEINIYSFHNGFKTEQKYINWQLIAQLLKKKEFIITDDDYGPIINLYQDYAYNFLIKLYVFLTKGKVPQEIRDQLQNTRLKELQSLPPYAQATASYLAKDREICRIKNQKKQRDLTLKSIQEHYQKIRQSQIDQNIIFYLEEKRQRQLRDLKKKLEDSKKHNNYKDQMDTEINEIHIKTFNKDEKKKEGSESIDGKETIDIFNKICLDFLQQKNIIDEFMDYDIGKNNKVIFILENPQLVQKKTFKQVIEILIDHQAQVNDCINNNYVEYKFFYKIIINSFENCIISTKSFKNLNILFQIIANFQMQSDPLTNQFYFETIVLEKIIKILVKQPHKIEPIVKIINLNCQNDTLSKQFKNIKDICSQNLGLLIQLSAQILSLSAELVLDENILNLLQYQSVLALKHQSPYIRSNGIKILNEILYTHYIPINDIIKKIEPLVNDDWWEIKAQILILCSNYLVMQSQDSFCQNINEEIDVQPSIEQSDLRLDSNHSQIEQPQENSRFIQKDKESKQQVESLLINIICKIFDLNSNLSILRVGLIYLAPVLNVYPQLCDRYLQILMQINDPVRQTILKIDSQPNELEGQIIKGYQTFKYKLTGAPLNWNSVGIAQSLEKYVLENNLENLEKVHIEILQGCLVNPLLDEDSEKWLNIYESLKNHIFLSFCDNELCSYGSDILKKIFQFEKINKDVLQSSEKIFVKIMAMIHHPEIQEICKSNLLDFFQYLYNEEQHFKDYIYQIIKDFCDKKKEIFLNSNLVQFMNNVSRERRQKLSIDQCNNIQPKSNNGSGNLGLQKGF